MKEQTVYHVGYLDNDGSFWSRRETEFLDYASSCVASFKKEDPKKDWVVIEKITKHNTLRLVNDHLQISENI